MNLKKQFASVLTAAAVLGATPALPMSVVNAAGDTADQLATITSATTPSSLKVKVTKTKTAKTVYVFQKVTIQLSGAKSFKSSNKKVATVTSKGVVKFKKAGKVNITFKKGSKKYTVTFTVKAATLTLSKSKVTVKVKKSYTVKAKTVKPANTVKWSSKNAKVATVKNGTITGKKKGTTYVYAKANGLTKSVKVTVK
ncbi:hypothetical protein SG0102_22410 [Intestinibaculum porci]|uniref:BIG2 domain-containing protein n=1 Tax=Intestinibaculum porci TaxID=2487118 RepID=A0A3G9J7W1_9FIRM|nr:hypothetical protein [Intestinibaculum porci]BBH27307.1 hypothetical protein SG0102_22410 [Intestinibaculum porci]